MNNCQKIAELRHFLARSSLVPGLSPLPLGMAEADAALGGGLRRGAVHEVYATDWGAGAFGGLLALKLAVGKPLFWIRPDYEALEHGGLCARGWRELGGDPRNLLLVRAPDAPGALAAGADILGCPHVGAAVIELSGHPRCLDLTASRKLTLAADRSGVALILLRHAAQAEPSAAQTRWRIAAAPSRGDDDWGAPTFDAELTRNRAGGTGRWTMEWDSQHGFFRDARRGQHAAHPGLVAATPAHRPAAAQRRIAL